MKKTIFVQLILLNVIFNLQAQSITEISLPDFGRPIKYASSDSIAVCQTSLQKMYYRNKHDSVWQLLNTGNLTEITGLYVDDNDIYLIARDSLNIPASGLMKTSDTGNSWQQKLNYLFLDTLQLLETEFVANDSMMVINFGFGVSYVPLMQPQLIDLTPPVNPFYTYMTMLRGDTLIAATDRGIFINDGLTTNWTQVSSANLSPYVFSSFGPHCYQFADPVTGSLYITTDLSNWPYPVFSYTLMVPDPNPFILSCNYDYYYFFRKSGNLTELYFTTDGINYTHQFLDFLNFNSLYQSEVLPDGDLLLVTYKGIFRYHITDGSIKDYMTGMRDMEITDAAINHAGNLLITDGENLYYKAAGNSLYSRLFPPDSINYHSYNRVYLSDSNNIYLVNDDPFQLFKSSDFGQSWILFSNQGFYHICNDSIWWAENGFMKWSFDGGNTFAPSVPWTFPVNTDDLNIIATGDSGKALLAYCNSNSFSVEELYLSFDFGQTFSAPYAIPFGGSVSGMPYAINDSSGFFLQSSPIADTVYKMPDYTNPYAVQTYLPGTFSYYQDLWTNNGRMYLARAENQNGNNQFNIYRADSLPGNFNYLTGISIGSILPSLNISKNFHEGGKGTVFWGMAENILVFKDSIPPIITKRSGHQPPVFHLHPNPASEVIYINSGYPPFHIFRSDGSLIAEIHYPKDNRIDISYLNDGIYFMKDSRANSAVFIVNQH